MEHEGLLQPETCFVEFGAGRGKLLHFVKQALGEHVPADYLAIDRESTRLKFDRFHTVRALAFRLPLSVPSHFDLVTHHPSPDILIRHPRSITAFAFHDGI
jgi:hypothetical protein